MTRQEYKKWRRVLRDNGRSALRWMPGHVRAEFVRLQAICGALDTIADRVFVQTLFKEAGLKATVRQTAPHHLLQKFAQSYR